MFWRIQYINIFHCLKAFLGSLSVLRLDSKGGYQSNRNGMETFLFWNNKPCFMNRKKHSKAKEGSIEDCYLQNRPHLNPNITDEIPVPQFICFQIFLKHFLLAKWRNEHLLISPTLHFNAPKYWPLKINTAKIANAVPRRNLLWGQN